MMARQKRQTRIQTVTYEGQDYHIELKPHQKPEAAVLIAERRVKELRDAQDRAQKIRRASHKEVTDSWRISDSRFANWVKPVDDTREGMHVNTVELKGSLLRYLDAFTSRKAMGLMRAIYPRYAEAFTLAYPLDDDAKGLSTREIGERLNLSQRTACRYIDRARFLFKALYLGVVYNPTIDIPEGEDDEDDGTSER